jgi:hypothetical protein
MWKWRGFLWSGGEMLEMAWVLEVRGAEMWKWPTVCERRMDLEDKKDKKDIRDVDGCDLLVVDVLFIGFLSFC